MTDDPQPAADPAHASGGADPGAAGPRGAGQGAPEQTSEEQLRAAYEAELNRITTSEMVLQTAVSLLNLGGRRLGLAGGSESVTRDLEQVRDAIDGVRALMPILERRMPNDIRPLRDALAQLQMAFAREANAKPAQPEAEQPPARPASKPSEEQQNQGPGPAEASGRLWVPGR